ncbi:carbohydrate ABC transporter permease [Paenibacillus tepidiphilus]|uniref:carbohydrate ABC transporter permease n=1 Tax=Paenibacillus tepidiphilus TaxID=2608683 RepID=UPI0013A53C27|nr:carbohydrate ABC transporter permease [Paenibacillus tepidiphilus]
MNRSYSSKWTSRRIAKGVLVRGISLGLMLYVLFPFLWLLLSSVKRPVDLLSRPPVVLPEQFTFKYYGNLFSNGTFLDALRNSLVVAGFTTLLSLVLGIFASYVFARLKFPGRKTVFLTILGSQMLPQMALLIPMFVLMRVTGLLYSYTGLILAYMTFSLPYVVWMYYSFLQSLPHEIEEASRIDGCTRLQSIFRIMLPLSATGLTATGVFVFIGAWNEFLLASILTDSGTRTLPTRISEFIGQDRIAYELMFPAGVVSCIPVLLLVLYFQRYIVQGLTEGGVK